VCTCSSLAAIGKQMRRVFGLSVIVLLLRLGLQVLVGAGASEVRQQHMSERDISFQQERVQATSKGEKEKGQQRCATHPLVHSTEQVAVKVRTRNMVRGSAVFPSARRRDGLILLPTPPQRRCRPWRAQLEGDDDGALVRRQGGGRGIFRAQHDAVMRRGAGDAGRRHLRRRGCGRS
jgi:hypothetical protein